MELRLQNFVGGTYVETRDDHRSELVDPSTGEVYGTAPISGAADVELAYEAAGKAFDEWRKTTPAQRQQALLAIADAVEARAAELVDAESRNTGKLVALTASEEIPP